MTQRKSSLDHAHARAFGRKLRSLRGNRTQAELAEQAGLTRSAVANYELGRSIPTDAVVEALANVLQVEFEALRQEPDTDDFVDVMKGEFPPDGSLSPDELALIRLLRCAPYEIIVDTVRQLIDYIESDGKAFRFMDEAQSAADLARLYRTLKRGEWRSGASSGSIVKMARYFSGEDEH